MTQAGPFPSPDMLTLFNSLLGAVPVGLAFFDRDLRYVRVNETLAVMNGLSPEAHVGRSLNQVLPALADEVADILRRVIETGEPIVGFQVSGEPVGRPGERRDWVASYYPARDPSGAIVGVSAVVNDVTEQRRAEVARRESEERFRTIARATSDALWDWDIRADTLAWSDGVRTLFGHDPATLGMSSEWWFARVHPDDSARVRAGVEAVLACTAVRWSDAYRFRRSDGTYADVLDRAEIIRDRDGVPIRAVGGMMDITERKLAEAALREREVDLRIAVGTARLGTWSVDLVTRTMQVCERVREILGWSPDGPISYGDLRALVHPDDRVLRDVVSQEEAWIGIRYELEHRIVRPDGSVRWIVVNGRAMTDADGRPIRALGVIMDVTDRKLGEERLARANADLEVALSRAKELAVSAEQASRAKSDFLAMMSHEIRTPLNGVIGMTGLLLDGPLGAEQRDFAETIRVSGEALLQIINDVLDFSKIDAGRLELEAVPCHPRSVVEDVVGLLAAQALERGIDVATLVEIPDTAPFLGDAGRIRQVLLNLVSNAVKFTEQGSVTVRACLAEDAHTESDGALIRFEVVDTGLGIPADVIPRLFHPFVQADGSTTRRHGGTGLGLAISKRLAEMLGGQIGVESVVGRGSRFWFTVRLARDRAATGEAAPRTMRGRNVLVVGDNDATRSILRQQLEAWDVSVATALNGDAALARLRNADCPFDAVIVDLEMPGRDGEATARAIRAEPDVARTPLLLLAALGHPVPEGLVDEAAGSLTKPIRPSRLHDSLLGLLDRRRPALRPIPEQQPAPRPKPTHAPRLLVAEDNPVNQKVAVRMLEKLGYRVDTVANGLEAVGALRSIPYAAVLMDCQMPEMDGYEASATIRRGEPRGRRTPIIAMTASAMQGDREKCLAAGMDDYLSKPVRPEDLAAVLARWIDRDQDPGTPSEAAEAG